MQKNKIIIKKSHAKLNLFLKVMSKRKDGFHNIFSNFYKIDLCDELRFKPSNKLTVKCNIDLGIPENENIVYKSAVALNEFTNQNNTVAIEIEKNIPVGAGLGGGSSNAATTLLTLNEMWNLNLKFDDLHSIAEDLGSDVPFFLYDEPSAIVFGKGEYLLPMDYEDITLDFKNFYYLLVNPKIFISTAKAYSLLQRKYDVQLKGLEEPDNFDFKEMFDYVALKNCLECSAKEEDLYFNNDFEEIIIQQHPELSELQAELMKLSDDRMAMTGSGSAFFALFKTLKKVEKAQEIIKSKFNMETFIGKLMK